MTRSKEEIEQIAGKIADFVHDSDMLITMSEVTLQQGIKDPKTLNEQIVALSGALDKAIDLIVVDILGLGNSSDDLN